MDIELIKALAKEHEEGRVDAKTLMAKACLDAYQQGFDEGVQQAETAHLNTHVLLHFTAGSA